MSDQQQPIIADIEGIGEIEFPAGTSPGVIQATVRKLVAQKGQQAAPPATEVPQEERSFLTDPDRNVVAAAAHGVVGAAKGLGSTVFGLGKMVHDYTPVGRLSDAIQPGAFEKKPAFLEPSNAQQRTGYAAEQMGEFFVPIGDAAKLGKAAEVAKSGALTLAQTGSPGTAGVSAGLTAVLPGAGAASRLAGPLRESAEKTVAQALGPTKEWAKDQAAKIAPKMLDEGIHGTRAGMLEQAKKATKEVGQQLEAAYAKASAAGETVDGLVIQGHLIRAKNALTTTTRTGKKMVIPGYEGAVQKLDRLKTFVDKLGDDIPVDKAHRVRQLWDKIVAKGGLYGPKATSSAADNEAAWTFREGANAFRDLLNRPNIGVEELNAEFAFWKGMKDVLKETQKRTQAQSGGLQAGIAASSGAAAGFASGDSMGERITGAFAGAAAGRQFVKLVQSPYWRTTISGPLKNQLANALASGQKGAATGAVQRMIASLPAQARQAFAQ